MTTPVNISGWNPLILANPAVFPEVLSTALASDPIHRDFVIGQLNTYVSLLKTVNPTGGERLNETLNAVVSGSIAPQELSKALQELSASDLKTAAEKLAALISSQSRDFVPSRIFSEDAVAKARSVIGTQGEATEQTTAEKWQFEVFKKIAEDHSNNPLNIYEFHYPYLSNNPRFDVPTLVKALNDGDESIHWGALVVLEHLRFHDLQLMDPLIQDLQDPNPKFRFRALRNLTFLINNSPEDKVWVETLRKSGKLDQVTRLMIDILDNKNESEGMHVLVIGAFKFWPELQVIEPLVRVIRDGESKLLALGALETLTSPQKRDGFQNNANILYALSSVANLANDVLSNKYGDRWNRGHAATILGNIQDPSYLMTLVAAASDESDARDWGNVRAKAKEALGMWLSVKLIKR